MRLYDEQDFASATALHRSRDPARGLAGVILRMKSLELGAVEDFPVLDPPAPEPITEGYRLLEGSARSTSEASSPRQAASARLPVDPRIGPHDPRWRRARRCLAEVLAVASALELARSTRAPRGSLGRRPTGLHRRLRKYAESDFIGLLRLWIRRDEVPRRPDWKRNALRKFCKETFLSYRRVTEWANVHDELGETVERDLKWEVPALGSEIGEACRVCGDPPRPARRGTAPVRPVGPGCEGLQERVRRALRGLSRGPDCSVGRSGNG